MLFNIGRTIKIANRKYTVKKYLNDDEACNLVDGVIEFLFDENATLPHYVAETFVIQRLTISAYTGYDFDERDHIQDIYKIYKQIKSRFDQEQYQEILNAIDDGINYKVAQMTSVMGDTEKMMNELNGMVDKIGADKIGKIINIGDREESIAMAQEAVKAEQAKNKK